MMHDVSLSPQLIGWREWLALPGLDVPAIKAKVDTGARTSALHTFFQEIFEQDGRRMVRFRLHPLQKRTDLELVCVAPVKDERVVSDSGGHKEQRIVIETELAIGELSWPVELTLTNRDQMMFRMLLGRTAMEGRLVVDPARSYVLGRHLAKTYKGLATPTP